MAASDVDAVAAPPAEMEARPAVEATRPDGVAAPAPESADAMPSADVGDAAAGETRVTVIGDEGAKAGDAIVHGEDDTREATPAVAAGAAVVPSVDDVRDAFKSGDAAASAALHKARAAAAVVAAPETHGGGGDFIKSLVFGGLDGIITTFSIVAAVAGASLSVEAVLLLGFANLIADGISMGLGDYLSEKAELRFARSEKKREEWELENHPEGEMEEMVALYAERGVGDADARLILGTMLKHPALFLEHMLAMELGQLPSDDANPALNGIVTFVSFVIFGSVPMIAYSIMFGAGYDNKSGMFGISAASTALTMFALGAVQARITRQPVIKTGTLMMLNGSLAAAAAYLVSWGLDQAIGNGESH